MPHRRCPIPFAQFAAQEKRTPKRGFVRIARLVAGLTADCNILGRGLCSYAQKNDKHHRPSRRDRSGRQTQPADANPLGRARVRRCIQLQFF